MTTISFIGAGNMANSLIGGLIKQGHSADKIAAYDIESSALNAIQSSHGIQIHKEISAAVAEADVVVLAVKPQVMYSVCKQIIPPSPAPLFVSIAAGLQADDINRWLGGNQSLVRCMPNTPALLGLGATALFANELVSKEQQQKAEQILSAAGITVWVESEDELDAVTAISGSGPAYYFLFLEAMQQAASELGLKPEVANSLCRQTLLGAAHMAAQDDDAVTLRQNVTSKGGTTEQAIISFENDGLRDTVQRACKAAFERSKTLAKELSQSE